MRRRAFRFFSTLIITALIVFDLSPVGTLFDLPGYLSMRAEQVKAEEGDVTYSFLWGSKEVNNNGEIDYSLFSTTDRSLSIQLKSSAGIAAGTTISWSTNNDNVVQVESQNDATCSVKLKIMSPGYSGLYCTITDPDGTIHAAAAFCSIYVPLEWSDNEASGNRNLMADVAHGQYYGLMTAQLSDSAMTLQMYTNDSVDFPNCDHYLRMLKYVDYQYTADSGKTGSVTSDVSPEELELTTAALTWESSDTTVCTVDSLTGMITAVAAGFARITVSTNTINERTGAKDSLSFNVIVIPEGHIQGYDSDNHSRIEERINPEDSQIVVQTNSRFASALDWKLFRGDQAVESMDVTSEFANCIEVSEATGRVVLTGLPAGVYYLTGISVKDSEASRILPTYDVTQANIRYFGAVIIIPLYFPVKEVVLNYYNKNVYDTFDLGANSNLPKKTFRFTSNDTETAIVGEDSGVIEATGIGECIITAIKISDEALSDMFGSYASSADAINYDGEPIKVNVTVVNGVAISSTSATIPLGSTYKLNLTAPNPYEGIPTWSTSDEQIVTVDSNGQVTACGVGDAVVTVKIKVNGVTKRAQCRIKVVNAVDGITLNSAFDYVYVGDNLTISAKISPEIVDTHLHWACSDTTIASIADTSDLSMTITGVQEGTVVISALNQDNAVVATKIIKVMAEITGITLSDEEVVIPETQGYYQLYAIVEPELPSNQKLTWSSSDNKIITVDENGKVHIVKPGKAVISVITENGKLATCTFTVTQGVAGIKFDDKSLTLFVGDAHRMTYVITPSNASNLTLKWSTTDTKVISIDATGLVTAKGVGTAIVIAEATDGSGIHTMCTVKVLRNAKAIKLDAVSVTLNIGQSYLLEYTLNPADSTDKVSFESSDAKIATVNKKGKIIGKSAGQCMIMAKTEGGITAYVQVNVNQGVSGVTLNYQKTTIYAGDELKLEATITPKGASDKGVTYQTSDKKIATVDDTGLVKGVGKGIAVIKCITDDGDCTDYCLLTVIEHIATFALEKEVTVYVNEERPIEVTITPETADNRNIVWESSNASVVTVDAEGKIKGLQVGSAMVKGFTEDGGLSDYCFVTVIDHVSNFSLQKSATVYVGESLTLEAKLLPDNADNKKIIWGTTDAKTVKVDDAGKITGMSTGIAVITGTSADTGQMDFCLVTVLEHVGGLSILDEVTINVGETKDLELKITPASASNQKVTWKSSNTEVATVDSKGIITGIGGGSCAVKVVSEDGNHMGYCLVTVIEPVTVIELPKTAEVGVGKKLQLECTVSGERATNKTIKWTTSKKKICKVSDKGVISGLKLGKCVITATALDGSGVSAECEVTVINATEDIEIDPSMTYITLVIGETVSIPYTITPANATHKQPVWTSSDEAVAMVNQKGAVTALKVGTTIVTATAKDNPSITSTAFVRVIEPVYATSITFAESEIVMTAGEVKTVPYSIVPSNCTEKFTWSSDNPVVATVNEATGQIMARGVGTATITLMTKSGKKGSIKVFVVGLSKSYVTLHQYEKLLLKLEIDGAGTSNLKVRWDTDNQTIAEISNGTVTAKALGTTTVYAIINGRRLPCTVKVVKNK